MATQAYFTLLADYNAWANIRLYDAAASLPDSDYRKDLGAFFGSLHRTLNHILVGDRIWLQRVEGEGDVPRDLDLVLYEDFHELRAAREAEDDRIKRIINGLSDAQIAGNFDYTNLRTGDHFTGQPLAPTLAHIFNHQTHHRGQAHTLLSQLGQDPPQLDILYLIR
jgi:uncharacterized damage-inducible protein DinB